MKLILWNHVNASRIRAALLPTHDHFLGGALVSVRPTTAAGWMSPTPAYSRHKRRRIMSVHVSMVPHLQGHRRHIRWIEIIDGTASGGRREGENEISADILYYLS